MSDWFSMEEKHSCANCGREGDLYTLEEARRRCGTGYGEWYCIEGYGCNAKVDDGHYECCNAPADLGHMNGCPNSTEDIIGWESK